MTPFLGCLSRLDSFLPSPIRLPHARKHMALHRQPLISLALPRPIQGTQATFQVAVEEEHDTIPISRITVDDPVHAALVLVPRPLGEHVAHVDDVGVWVGGDGDEGVGVGVEDLEAGVLVLEEQGDGAEVGVGARAELPLLGRLGGRVVQEPEGRGGRVGGEVCEDVGAVWEGAGDQVEDLEGQIVDGRVVIFCWLLELGGGQEGGRRPDIGTHEEATGEDQRRGGGKGGADVETLRDCREGSVWRMRRWLGGNRYLLEVRHHIRLV
jgi:hypothetical protein